MTSSWIHDDGAQPQRLGDCTVARQHNMVGGVDVIGCVRSCRLHSTIGVCSCSRVRAGDVFKLLAQSRAQFIAQNGRHEHGAHRALLSNRTGIQYEQQFNLSADIFQLHICVWIVFHVVANMGNIALQRGAMTTMTTHDNLNAAIKIF